MPDNKKVKSVRFNQDQACFACSMESEVRIYNVDPLIEILSYDTDVGPVSKCEILFRTNIIAVVTGDPSLRYADNILSVYDMCLKKKLLQIVFASSIRAVRLRRDKMIVALLNQIHVFSFPTPIQRLFTLETRQNHKGLCEVSPLESAEKQILIFPGQKLGSLQLVDLWSTETTISSAPVWIATHKAELGCIALNQQGTRAATASIKGTLIRVWDTTSKNLLVELRRGTDPATIYCINFSRDCEYLCCSSDKGTVHIFAIKDTNLNKRMILPSGGMLGKYGESQWALTNFTVPPESACICAFGPDSSVIAVCLDGTFHKYAFNTEGTCNKEAFDVYLNICDEEKYLQWSTALLGFPENSETL